MPDTRTEFQENENSMPDQSGPSRGSQAAMRQGLRTSLLPDLIYTVIGPFILYQLLSPHMPVTYALLLAGVLPAARTVMGLVRSRRLNPLGVLSLLTIALNIFSGLVLKDARLQLLSRSLPTACIGLLMLASLLTKKPLITRLAEYLRASATPSQKARFQERFKGQFSLKREMRSFFKLLTAIWGVGLFLELALHAVLVYTLTTSQMILVGPILSYGFLGGLLLLTMLLFKWLPRTQQKTLKEAPEQLSAERWRG